MFIFSSRKLARLAFMAVLACTATLLLVDASSAAARKLSGTYSGGQLKASCDANGGSFGTHSDGGYYCDGTGGSVICNKKGKCTGYCQNCAAVAKGVNGILRPPGSAGTASAAHGSTPSKSKKPIRDVGRHKVKLTGSDNTGNSSKKSSKH